MYSCNLRIVIGILATVSVTVVLATSDPGYSPYYRLYNSRQRGYSNYGSASLPQQNYQDPYYRSVGEAYKSLPSRRGKSYQRARPAYTGFENHPSYYSEHPSPKPYRGGLKPHRYGHNAKYHSHHHQINVPKPYPKPHPQPHPIARPEPHPITHPHPIPQPHPKPIPHPITHPKPIPHPQPEPIPHPIPHPTPSPVPIPILQPNPVPAPTPVPQPTPFPTPEEIPDIFVPDIVVEEDITIPSPPVIVQPLPIEEKPDVELPPEDLLPVRPIETIGRPPVAPSVKPPTFFNLQGAVPGFVDIQRVNIRPLGEPAILIPQEQINDLQFSTPSTIVDSKPNPFQNNIDSNSPIETLFPVDNENFVGTLPGPNTHIETLFPVDNVVLEDTTRTRQPIFEPKRVNVEPIPIQNTINTQEIPFQNKRRFQQAPAQNVLNIPLLAKAVPAVPAVPESNPQPLFKDGNVETATAQATALLLQASQADFASFRNPIPLPTNNPRAPFQPLPSVRPQIDNRRLPSVVLPDPVPAVPLTPP